MAIPQLSYAGTVASAARLPTAPLAAGGLIAGYAVAIASGSRPLGGVVLGACGLACIAIWLRRDGGAVARDLTAVGVGAFVVSHGLGMLIGAWPAVLVCAAGVGVACERRSDARHRRSRAV